MRNHLFTQPVSALTLRGDLEVLIRLLLRLSVLVFLLMVPALLQYQTPTPIMSFWCQQEPKVTMFLLMRVSSSCQSQIEGQVTLVEQLPIWMCQVPFQDFVLHQMPTIFDLKKNFILRRYFSLISVVIRLLFYFLVLVGEFMVFMVLLFMKTQSQSECNFPSVCLYAHLNEMSSFLGSQQKISLWSYQLPLTFSRSSLLQCLKELLPMKAYWMDLFCSVMNFLMDMDMLFSFDVEPRECSLMCRVQIIDFRSLILSYFCLMQTRRTAIYSCMFLIYLAFFLSSSLSSLKRWLVYFSRFSTINFYSYWVSMIRSSSPLDLRAFVMKLQQSVMVLNSKSISLISFCSAIIISFIFYSVLAFSFRTARLILMGMSQGLLYEMNFNSSLCTRSASIQLFFLQRASSIYSLIFSGGDPLGAYFYASWLKYVLSVALKLSASAMDCPLMKEVSLEQEEQVEFLPWSVLSLFPIGFRFFLFFFQPYQPPAQLRLPLMPSMSSVAQRSRSSDYIFPFMGCFIIQEEKMWM